MRAIYKCKNKACGNVWAFDYPEQRVTKMGYGRTQRTPFRRTPEGRTVDIGYDGRCCEKCRSEVKTVFVKGVTTEHVCDDRCASATGFQCLCSCGGKNHGKQFLCAEAA